ncbi:unnamed protein product [Brassica oleracea]
MFISPVNDSNIVSKVIHTPNDSSFSSVLSLTIQNPRFSSPEMGEEFFWAIRGGGGSSFCVVLSWKAFWE